MAAQQDIQLIERYVRGELQAEAREELDKRMQADDELHDLFLNLKLVQYYNAPPAENELSEKLVNSLTKSNVIAFPSGTKAGTLNLNVSSPDTDDAKQGNVKQMDNKSKSWRPKLFMGVGGLAAAALVVFFITIGTGKVEQAPGVLTISLGDVTIDGVKAKRGTSWQPGSELVVGKRGIATVQFGKGAQATFKANARITYEYEAGAAKPTVQVYQRSGMGFHKVSSGSMEYTVKTPTMVAGVRGTSFGIEVAGLTSTLLVSEGKVLASPRVKLEPELRQEIEQALKEDDLTTEQKEVLLKVTLPDEQRSVVVGAGEKISSKQKKGAVWKFKGVAEFKEAASWKTVDLASVSFSKKRKISKKQEQALQLLDSIPLVGKIDVENNDFTKIDIFDPQKKISKIGKKMELKGPAKNSKTSLADIAAKYGPLAVIQLKNGQKYIGAFVSKGALMVIHHTDGKTVVPQKEVKSVSKYSGK